MEPSLVPRRRPPLLVLAIGLGMGVPMADAQTVHVVPSIAVESTLTDNVNLTTDRMSDWVNQFTPSVTFSEVSGHAHVRGNISLPILLYVRTSEKNRVFPQANITGTYEAIDKFLFVDANATVSQQYTSPFGARPSELSNATQNRYTAQSYRVSPYVRGVMPGNLSYELRDNNIWSDANASAIATGRSYTNEVVGHVNREATPAGWALEYDRSDIRFSDSESQIMEIERLRGIYRVDPTVEVSASVGYEDNRFFTTRERGPTYGAGLRWRPTDRTSVNAKWEHRFFGASYDASFDHTTRLSVWSIRATRKITSFPQQLATLPEGGDVVGLLNALYSSRIPDLVQRQTIVDQLIRDRDLPNVLTGPVPLLTEQITLAESLTATLGLLGARNSVFFGAFRLRNQPVEGTQSATLSPLLGNLNNNTQVGANGTWTHQLEQNLTLGTNLTWSRTTDNSQAGMVTRLYVLRAFLSRHLTALTVLYGGARFQDSRSNTSESFREAALFVGLNHTFH